MRDLVSLHAHLYLDGYSGMAAVEQVLVSELDTARAFFEGARRFAEMACAFQEGTSFAKDNRGGIAQYCGGVHSERKDDKRWILLHGTV